MSGRRSGVTVSDGAPVDAAVDFQTAPERYRHWRLAVDGPVATLTMAGRPRTAACGDDYELKLNSYDLGVDIELHDVVQRLRFEHPEVHAVVRHRRPRQGVLRRRQHPDAGRRRRTTTRSTSASSPTRRATASRTPPPTRGQVWIAAVNGTAAGGGYELALACDEILLIDDRASAVSLPEVPLLGVLPGTGGLTRVVDKRHVRRDLADVFATRAEGVQGPARRVEWGLVDAIAPRSRFDERRAGAGRGPGRPRPTGPTDGPRRRASTPLDRRRRRRRIALRARRRWPSTASSAPRTSPCTRPAGPPAADAGRARRRRAPTPGCSPRAGSSTTPSSTSASTSPRSARGCSHTAGDPARRARRRRRARARNADHWLVREVRLLLGPHAQAPRPLGPHARRPDRARELLRRHAGRAGAGRRPLVHARRARPDDDAARRPRCGSPTPTTAGTRWRTG